MAKKFGKFVLFTAAATAAAAAAYHFYQKKNSELDFDEDFDIPESLINDEEESIPVPQDVLGEENTPAEEENSGTAPAQANQGDNSGEGETADGSSEGDSDGSGFAPLSEGVSDSSFENAGEVKENEEQFF